MTVLPAALRALTSGTKSVSEETMTKVSTGERWSKSYGVYRKANVTGIFAGVRGAEVVFRFYAQLKHLVVSGGCFGPISVCALDYDPPYIRKLIE